MAHFGEKSTLSLKVFTSPSRSFVSSGSPEGEGDDPTWSPSSSTLIYGETDAVLVDIPATNSQVDSVADWIESTGKRLTRVFITHGHGDHWLGLARLFQRFPDASGLATAPVLARAQFEAFDPALAAYWSGIFPGEVPLGADTVLPDLLDTDVIALEGHELRVIPVGQADTAHSTVLYAPTLSAVVTGDLAYNRVHMMTAEAGASDRERWIANLDEIAALDPSIVVAGHKKVDRDDAPEILRESQQYLRDFGRVAGEESNAPAIVRRMADLYPDWENLRTVWHSSRAAAARAR